MPKDTIRRLNKAMRTISGQIEDQKKRQRQVETTKNSIARIDASLEDLKPQLQKQTHDLKQLTHLSFANFYHTLINDKDEQLNKEGQEVLRLKGQLDHLLSAKAREVKHLDALVEGMVNKAVLEVTYKKYRLEKVALIQSYMPKTWQELERIQGRIEAVSKEKEVINEATVNGAKVMKLLEQIKSSLAVAVDLGGLDIMGSGMLVAMAKYSHVDQLHEELHDFQQQLRLFSREIKEVSQAMSFNVGIDLYFELAEYCSGEECLTFLGKSQKSGISDKMAKLGNLILTLLEDMKTEYNRCNYNLVDYEKAVEEIILNA